MLESLDLQKPDAVYCLGDLVGYNVWLNEIIEQIRRRRIATIAGNHDAKVKNLSVKQLEEPGRNYGYKIIEEKNKKYLATLPAHIRIEFQLNNVPLNILLVHGSPSVIMNICWKTNQKWNFWKYLKKQMQIYCVLVIPINLITVCSIP